MKQQKLYEWNRSSASKNLLPFTLLSLPDYMKTQNKLCAVVLETADSCWNWDSVLQVSPL